MTEPDATPTATKRPRLGIDGMFAAAATLTLGVTVLGLLGQLHWAIDLLGHQRRVYALALLVALAWLLIRKRWAWATVAGVGLAINAWLLAPLYLGGHAPAAEGAMLLRVVTFNVNTANPNHSAVTDWLATTDADVIAVLEVDRGWVDSLEAVDGYRVAAAEPRSDNFGVALLTRSTPRASIAMTDTQVVYQPEDAYRLPTLEATLHLGDETIALLVAHPVPPMGAAYAADHAATLAWLGKLAADRSADPAIDAVIVAGDLNATPFSHAWPALTKPAGLINSQRGHGWSATWPDRLVPIGLGIPIDHVLHTDGLTTLSRSVGSTLGSDHHAVVVDLAATP
ncbi:MAG: endonuclease/exonuclease/phosphatase family protein [Planctomycetota bacterium]